MHQRKFFLLIALVCTGLVLGCGGSSSPAANEPDESSPAEGNANPGTENEAIQPTGKFLYAGPTTVRFAPHLSFEYELDRNSFPERSYLYSIEVANISFVSESFGIDKDSGWSTVDKEGFGSLTIVSIDNQQGSVIPLRHGENDTDFWTGEPMVDHQANAGLTGSVKVFMAGPHYVKGIETPGNIYRLTLVFRQEGEGESGQITVQDLYTIPE